MQVQLSELSCMHVCLEASAHMAPLRGWLSPLLLLGSTSPHSPVVYSFLATASLHELNRPPLLCTSGMSSSTCNCL